MLAIIGGKIMKQDFFDGITVDTLMVIYDALIVASISNKEREVDYTFVRNLILNYIYKNLTHKKD